MITYSGVHIQKIGQPAAEGTPTAVDIAVHAGRICRFGGSVWYPLLAHLIFVGLLAYKRTGRFNYLIWGLLHDAHEAVTSDVPRPFKCSCMRFEQQAIDIRLFAKFFGTEYSDSAIDFDLIKRCDIDAAHIEGVHLGVPDFAEIEIAHSADYTGRNSIYNDPDDVELFHRVRKAYGGFETVQGEESSAVRGLIYILTAAEQNDSERIDEWMRSWGKL